MRFDWTKLVSWWPTNVGKPKIQAGVMLLVALVLLFSFCSFARASDGCVQLGIGRSVVRGPATAIDLALIFPDAAPGNADFELGTTFIGPSLYDDAPQRQNFAIRAGIIEGWGKFDVRFGLAYLQNTDGYNGSNLNFMLGLAYRFHPNAGAMQLHFSNGGTRKPNQGRDLTMATIRRCGGS